MVAHKLEWTPTTKILTFVVPFQKLGQKFKGWQCGIPCSLMVWHSTTYGLQIVTNANKLCKTYKKMVTISIIIEVVDEFQYILKFLIISYGIGKHMHFKTWIFFNTNNHMISEILGQWSTCLISCKTIQKIPFCENEILIKLTFQSFCKISWFIYFIMLGHRCCYTRI